MNQPFKIVLFAWMISILLIPKARSEDGDLLKTSFEELPVGPFQRLSVGACSMEAQGTASISSEFFHTGKQCLHLSGEAGSALTLYLPSTSKPLRGLGFRAERWTSRDPFSFSIEVLEGEVWKEVAKLDHVVEVGKRFRTDVRLAIPSGSAPKAIRFLSRTAPNSGVLLDDLFLSSVAPDKPTAIPSTKLPQEQLPWLDNQPLFVSGTEGTHTFRIPAIITALNGDLIAACDARRKSAADLKPQRTIDIVFRRSTDDGKTWSPIQVLDPIDDGGCSDPSLLLDKSSGTIFCFYNYMSSDMSSSEFRFKLQKSTDHGKTWSQPIDFTDQVAGPELKHSFKFITSGRGIQLRDGSLLHNFVRVKQGVTLFGSQDHGATWKAVSEVTPADESKVVQLPDDSLLVHSRWEPGKRYVHRSVDGGKNWNSQPELGLPDPQCNASILQYTSKRDGHSKDRLLFCNAASFSGRKNLAVRISYDSGATWSEGKVIDPGPSAYSEMTVLRDGTIGVLYEPGHSEIRFVRFTLEALTGGSDRLTAPFTFP